MSVTEYSFDFIDDYISPNYILANYFTIENPWEGSVRNYPFAYPEPQITNLRVNCYDVNGGPAPGAIIRVELISGRSLGTIDNGPVTASADSNGVVSMEIAKGSNLRFKLDRLDNISTKGSYFNGTEEGFLELELSID